MEERIALMRDDPAVHLTVDANAIGGLLASLFGAEITAMTGQCASCNTVSVVGTMRTYMRGPGIVVRCPACAEVVLRVVQTPTANLLDVRGARYIRLARGEPVQGS
jgi:hypothetical protein